MFQEAGKGVAHGESLEEYQPDQMMLLPPSLEEWLPKRHLACFICDVDVVVQTGLSRITRRYETWVTGQPHTTCG